METHFAGKIMHKRAVISSWYLALILFIQKFLPMWLLLKYFRQNGNRGKGNNKIVVWIKGRAKPLDTGIPEGYLAIPGGLMLCTG
jgi:hypothetical protein